ncbi:uncharacterized protein LOC131687512 [Topomyia yanbarensis]|uniref:uncharacterized protein LOC131687512 n=1 Tax=Topomyia yanbarensis TaxID=2498891 RepID=UPI00273ACC21|nr:uncharacterized protein LOC131687512 [Topomyia yanbarensis]
MAQRLDSSTATFYNSLQPQHRRLYKSYAQAVGKLCAQLSRKEFVRRCRKYGLNPTHIQNSFRCINGLLEDASPYRGSLQKAIDRFKRTIINIEIKDSFYKIKQLEETKVSLVSQITQATPPHICNSFFSCQECYFNKQGRALKAKTDSKFQRLMAKVEVESPLNFTVNESWIRNTTDVEVPKETMLLLGYGPKFALPFQDNREIPYFKIIADLESILKLEPDDTVQAASRNQFTNIIHNYVNKRKNGCFKSSTDPVNHFLIEAYHTTQKFIRNNPEICIVAADKGNKTVIMKKEEYEMKMQTLVGDSDTYEGIDTDWTNKVQTKNNQMVHALYDQKMIDQKTRHQLITHHATCPKIYDLPKIHKPNSPLRVILPCINCPTYDLSKYLAGILRLSINQNKYNILNSYEFCSFINNTTLPPNHVLVSFDVVSLFTCIPEDLVIQAVRNNWSSIEKNTTIKDKKNFHRPHRFQSLLQLFRISRSILQAEIGNSNG